MARIRVGKDKSATPKAGNSMRAGTASVSASLAAILAAWRRSVGCWTSKQSRTRAWSLDGVARKLLMDLIKNCANVGKQQRGVSECHIVD